tara:strand:- start:321 stop:536 length:216 start_codon:yes stop_codon:yes gene_type:complete
MADVTKTITLANQSSRSTIAVIDAIAQRGGFKGEELMTIGTLRDQCVQLIQLAEAFQQEAANAATPAASKK